MNIVCVPYHDWRKIEQEGARTRDAHLIKHFSSNSEVDKVVVISRPTSHLELLLRRKKRKISGTPLIRKNGMSLIKISEKLYVIDYVTKDVLKPVLKKKLWFFESFGYKRFVQFCKDSFSFLGLKDYYLISNNIFSIDFVSQLDSKLLVFDAYDNQVFFPHNQSIKSELVNAYKRFTEKAHFWVTNSTKNIEYYKENYDQDKCYLVKNGVDIDVFRKNYKTPADLMNIKKPILGFGGKITHLFDYELFNYCVEQHPDKSFVLVGQILAPDVYAKISKAANVFYLGDKHYNEYPSYVCNFNIGIVPYVTNDLESGVDSIKVYEYLAAGLSCVGTKGGGMQDMSEYIYVANDKYEFSDFINKAIENPKNISMEKKHSWEYKAEYIIEKMENYVKI